MVNEEKTIIVFDATELDNFDLCKLRWHLYHHLHLRPKRTPHYFETGSLLHDFMEMYYKYKRDVGMYVPQNVIEDIIERGRISSLKYNMELEEMSEMIFQFREYHRYYEEENLIPVYVEEPFLVKIYEDETCEIFISGKPDLVFRYPHSSTLCILDHKSVRRDTDISPLRNQFLLYTTALNTDTFIVNKIGFQKTKSPKDRFLRSPYVYSDEIKEEWKQEVIFKAKEMILYQQSEYYPRNRTSCEKMDGCYLKRYCSTKPRAREFLIGTEYLVGEEWDVTGKLEESKK